MVSDVFKSSAGAGPVGSRRHRILDATGRALSAVAAVLLALVVRRITGFTRR